MSVFSPEQAGMHEPIPATQLETTALRPSLTTRVAQYFGERYSAIKDDLTKTFLLGTIAFFIAFLHTWATSIDNHNQQRLRDYSERSKAFLDSELTVEPAVRYLKWRYWYSLDQAGKQDGLQASRQSTPLPASKVLQLNKFEREAENAEANWNKNDKVAFFMLAALFDEKNAGTEETRQASGGNGADADAANGANGTDFEKADGANVLDATVVVCSAPHFGPDFQSVLSEHQDESPWYLHNAMNVCFNKWFDQIKNMRGLMDDNYVVSATDRAGFEDISAYADFLGQEIFKRENEYELSLRNSLQARRDEIRVAQDGNLFVRLFSFATQ